MRVFVTGSGGILGRHVLKHLNDLAPDAEIIRNSVDLVDAAAIRHTIQGSGPIDLVLHLAAVVPVSDVQANPAHAYAVNVGGTVNLMEALGAQSPRFVYCSSAHVYASNDDAITEDASVAPVSLYGRTKWLAELALADIAAAQGTELCIGRVFSIHDPEQTGTYLRPAIEKRLATEDLSKPFELFGAESLRDFLTADRAARLLVRLALSDATGPVNIGSGQAMRVADFVQLLSSETIKITPKGSTNALVADVTRLRAILGDLDA